MPLFAMTAALLALPWLWPFTAGPLTAALPYLAAAAAAALLLPLWPRDAAQGARVAAAGWLAAAAVSALIALLQYFDLEAPLHPWVNIAQPGQAFGNLRQPNQLATLLMIGVLALRWLHGRGALRWGWAAALGALLLAALAATASRVGLVELLAVGALALWWGWGAGGTRRSALLAGVLLALGVFALAALLLPWALQASEGLAGRALVERLQHAESSCGSRLVLWRNVLQLIGLKPWTGWGWGELAYAHDITLYQGERFCHILDNAHNLPLHLAVELGLPLALLACAALAWGLWRGRPWAERDPTRQLAWGVLAVIGLHSGVEYPLWYGPFQIAVLICFWLLWATGQRRSSASSYQKDTEPGAPGGLRLGLAALLLGAVAYAGWDYRRISQIYLPTEQRAAAYQGDAMAHARRSWLYAGAVRFADVTTRPAVPANAARLLPEALQALHFSPEPRVITRVIESATLLGQDELALAHLARFRAAFPQAHADWVQDNARVLQGARALLQGAASDARSAAT